MTNLAQEERIFWYADDESWEVRQEICQLYDLESPDRWWVPKARRMVSREHHLFETKNDALRKLIQIGESRMRYLEGHMDKLRTMLSEELDKLDLGTKR